MYALRNREVDAVVVFKGNDEPMAARRKAALKVIDAATEKLDKGFTLTTAYGEAVTGFNVWRR